MNIIPLESQTYLIIYNSTIFLPGDLVVWLRSTAVTEYPLQRDFYVRFLLSGLVLLYLTLGGSDVTVFYLF